MCFEEKLAVAHSELTSAGIKNSNPFILKLLRRIGLRKRPFYYSNFISNLVFFTCLCTCLYMVISILIDVLFNDVSLSELLMEYINHNASLSKLIMESINKGVLFGFGFSIHYIYLFKKHKLSSWNDLNLG
ncbi:DUF6404 family protein [Psychromonas sp. KJ10-10]|uniref:DUF6404 family protein n=1 Tax=Psychromonas sp. KJ10-10 TaxID=3391823 RepID=UPI0039B51DAB